MTVTRGGDRRVLSIVAALIAGIAGAATVVAVQWALGGAGLVGVPVSGSSATSDQSTKELWRLAGAVEGLRSQLDAIKFEQSVRSTDSPQRLQDPSGITAEDLAALSQELVATRKSLDAVAALCGTSFSIKDYSEAAPSKKAILRKYLDNGAIPVEGWRFWSIRQLLETYGPPDGVGAPLGGRVVWQYEWPDKKNVTFVLSEGMALEIMQDS